MKIERNKKNINNKYDFNKLDDKDCLGTINKKGEYIPFNNKS